jgi:hypothetical protein
LKQIVLSSEVLVAFILLFLLSADSNVGIFLMYFSKF